MEALPRRAWSDLAEDALEHCYTGDTIARRAVLTGIMEQIQPDPNICPYCLLRQPTSLDHFLPKDFFPEFSVLAWNLVYVCDPCNRKKGNRFVVAPRDVINPYFDEMPDTALLHADVRVTAGGIGVRFSIAATDPEVPAAIVDLMRRHYAALSLEKDYFREGAAVVSDLVNAITSQHRVPIDQGQLDAAIDNRMREWSNYPINSYRVAVIEALELSPGFLGYVNDRIAAAPRPPRARPLRDLAALRAAAAARAAAL
ncbi:hypothetical protein QH494_03720 [Sphingomonas sp. AR_OL41]|uniref:HNH endonuclease n=1 Tax=Sphingomonas sp. AR_OL41 TaxID=3042729 RepID=UPI002481294B|nr:hypothetical protein [Sphingomonas sp. AR_OL41]MDH7971278.1 hypothetical protein [Sphingomonas sp. AR_OL41]